MGKNLCFLAIVGIRPIFEMRKHTPRHGREASTAMFLVEAPTRPAAPAPASPTRALATVHTGTRGLLAAQVPRQASLGALARTAVVLVPARPLALMPATPAHEDTLPATARLLLRYPSLRPPFLEEVYLGSAPGCASSQVRDTPAPSWPGGAACFLSRCLAPKQGVSQNCFSFFARGVTDGENAPRTSLTLAELSLCSA